MSLGARQISFIESCEAERRVRSGTAVRLYRLDGNYYDEDVDGSEFAGYVLCEAPKRDEQLSRAFLTRRQTDMAAGVHGQSMTAFFGAGEAGEKQRQSYAEATVRYRGRVIGLEDEIELAQVKLSMLNPLRGLQDRIVVVKATA